uniref:Apple domain-containing protein n=1 Tax=Plectus sambesii TaxID=2011161 RepID=A0A914UN68_9BILA
MHATSAFLALTTLLTVLTIIGSSPMPATYRKYALDGQDMSFADDAGLIASVTATDRVNCAILCANDVTCQSFQFNGTICSTYTTHGKQLVSTNGAAAFDQVDPVPSV